MAPAGTAPVDMFSDPASARSWTPSMAGQVWTDDETGGEHRIGTLQLRRRSELRVVIGRLIVPSALIVVAGIVIGVLVALGEGPPEPEPTTAPEPVAPAAAAPEPVAPVAPGPAAPERTGAASPEAAAAAAAAAAAPAAAAPEPSAAAPPEPTAATVEPIAEPARPPARVDVRVDSPPSGATV
ncbi:MAG TPA: hypothetical protein VGD80_14010, partial [Kofleriaceae bacterium]